MSSHLQLLDIFRRKQALVRRQTDMSVCFFLKKSLPINKAPKMALPAAGLAGRASVSGAIAVRVPATSW